MSTGTVSFLLKESRSAVDKYKNPHALYHTFGARLLGHLIELCFRTAIASFKASSKCLQQGRRLCPTFRGFYFIYAAVLFENLIFWLQDLSTSLQILHFAISCFNVPMCVLFSVLIDLMILCQAIFLFFFYWEELSRYLRPSCFHDTRTEVEQWNTCISAIQGERWFRYKIDERVIFGFCRQIIFKDEL